MAGRGRVPVIATMAWLNAERDECDPAQRAGGQLPLNRR